MNGIDITAIVLALVGMVSGWITWFFDRKKHRQEVESMRNDNKHKEMDLAKKYVDEYDRTIAQRLRNDVNDFPIIMQFLPALCSSSTNAALSSGSTCAFTSSTPSSLATRLATLLLSPVNITTLSPKSFSF